MWLIAGTVPEKDFSLYIGRTRADFLTGGESLLLADGRRLPVGRGTTALAATVASVCEQLEIPAPWLLLAGDSGTGDGSRKAYDWLTENLASLALENELEGITFHYFYPDVDYHNRILMAMEELPSKPVLVADAGFMYVAKMSGYAAQYDLFTPDIGELAFLADEKAPHPFYTRGFLSAAENDIPALLERALKNGNCPSSLIIKGATDYIMCNDKLVAMISEPGVAAMECIGGTGDIVTGFATAYLCAGLSICRSSIQAVLAARYLAEICKPDPSCQAVDLIREIGPMLKRYGKLVEDQSQWPCLNHSLSS